MDDKKTVPEQNPSAPLGDRDNTLEASIGREINGFRKKLGMTVAELSAASGISVGMLSKIENGTTSPSLTTLQMLSNTLSVPVSAFFRRFEERRAAVFVKAGEGLHIDRRGTRAGHQLRGQHHRQHSHSQQSQRGQRDFPCTSSSFGRTSAR